jgi:hypothetical protein
MYRLDNLCQTGWLICLFFVIPPLSSPSRPFETSTRILTIQGNLDAVINVLQNVLPSLEEVSSRFFSIAIDFYNSRFPRFEENGPAVSATRMPVSWSTRAKLVALSDAVELKWKNSVRYIIDSFPCLIKQIVTSRTIADATMLYDKLFLFRRKT